MRLCGFSGGVCVLHPKSVDAVLRHARQDEAEGYQRRLDVHFVTSGWELTVNRCFGQEGRFPARPLPVTEAELDLRSLWAPARLPSPPLDSVSALGPSPS